jgi:spore maturation protein CgeB
MDIVILGLSITSSWGNGHATTYRSLISGLSARGHKVLFLERDVPWYAGNRDLPQPPFCRTELYPSVAELKRNFESNVRNANLVIVGSYVPEGVDIGDWVTSEARSVTAFYDIDTPITIRKLERGDTEYLAPLLIPRYNLYLSFTGGPVLQRIETQYGSRAARPLYCSVDPRQYYSETAQVQWHLGYLGTYSADRHVMLEELLIRPAREWPEGRFVVAGPQYPSGIDWPPNITRIDHVPPGEHRRFYNSQRFTLNLTRTEIASMGYSPSVHLFEAAACETLVISDYWPGLETFLVPDKEILVASTGETVLQYMKELKLTGGRTVAFRARQKVLSAHTGIRRAVELEAHVAEVRGIAARRGS